MEQKRRGCEDSSALNLGHLDGKWRGLIWGEEAEVRVGLKNEKIKHHLMF